MKTFLEEVAEKVYRDHPKLENVTVVFPNRRAALYFRKHLTALIARPVFAPRIVTIEDLFKLLSNADVPDKLILISVLFGSYRDVMNSSSEDKIARLEDFYFWGDMLLRDFEEVDKYMVPAEQLFKDLSHQKEIDTSFDFLTDEQKTFLKEFWSNFDVTPSANKNRFLSIWRRLWHVYQKFRTDLRAKGMAYEGMLQRDVAETLHAGALDDKISGHLVFAGFNALTAAEEKLITHCVERHKAEVHWDVDAYYLNNRWQEAGMFFREYQQKAVLGKTFSADTPAHFQEKIATGKEVHLYGATQPIAQAKLMSQVLSEAIAAGMNPEETLVVLADEKMLMPVLYGISGSVEKLNVTMGFPLASTPMFNFIELLIDLQINRKGDHFNHRQVLAILGHAYVVAAHAPASNEKRKEILEKNWVHIPKGYLATQSPLHRKIFTEVSADHKGLSLSLVDYLQEVIREVGALNSVGDLDKEYALHFVKFFNVLGSVLLESADVAGVYTGNLQEVDVRSMKTFLRLFRQLVSMQKIPFSGEPLRGLQVMGVLETRNLDFKNVFMLSLNEGAFPSTGGKGSYIPHNIRKAYALPTLAHQDAMYSYLFYRTLQRAENIYLFYNSETDVLGQGEMSRYLQQLLFESGLNIQKHVLHNPIQPHAVVPLSVAKDDAILATLENLVSVNESRWGSKGISPSALNAYIECRLQFYFKYVARIREPKEIEEELDARVLGNFLHKVMENFYKDLAERKGSNLVEKADFKNAAPTIAILIDNVFREAYKLDPDKPVEYAGQRLVVYEIVKRFASQILKIDHAYAPFAMEALEKEGLVYGIDIDRPPYKAILGGKIDRVDRKDDRLRIIDYKTGKDTLDFESIDSLFNGQGRRNKAAFQTLLYALMYVNSVTELTSAGVGTRSERIVPGLINRMNVFDPSFEFGLKVGKQQVTDVASMFPEFERKLKELFEELLDPARPFDQTTNRDACKYCAYRNICYR